MRRSVSTTEVAQRTAIDDAVIEQLVRAFYARVRDDTLLAPIFAARIADWEPHLKRMCAFWSSVVLMSGRYHGQPTKTHLSLPIEWGDALQRLLRELPSAEREQSQELWREFQVWREVYWRPVEINRSETT